jgi:hypothetical protein
VQINGALASLSLPCIVSLLSFGPGDDSPFFKQLASRVNRFIDLSAVKQRDGFGVAGQVRACLYCTTACCLLARKCVLLCSMLLFD